jgi:hypothetical protein
MSTPIDPDPGPSACNLQEFVSAIPGLALDEATKMWIKKWGASIPVPQSLCGTLGQGDLESVSQYATALFPSVSNNLVVHEGLTGFSSLQEYLVHDRPISGASFIDA